MLTGLAACTNYEFEVATTCGSLTSTYSSTYNFTTVNCGSGGIRVELKVFLEGPFNTTSMSNDLQTNNLIPLNQPYNTTPWNYNGSETVSDLSSISSNTNDWILLELRSSSNAASVVETKAAFLQTDGTVVSPDGSVGVGFSTSLSAGSYYIVVRHRNHLDVMSANAINLPNVGNPYDFTSAATQAYGPNQQIQLGLGIYGLYAGDMDRNGVITYADFNAYLPDLNAIYGYFDGDLDMDGLVKPSDFLIYSPHARVIGVDEIRY